MLLSVLIAVIGKRFENASKCRLDAVSNSLQWALSAVGVVVMGLLPLFA
jgi:hypothetical protein